MRVTYSTSGKAFSTLFDSPDFRLGYEMDIKKRRGNLYFSLPRLKAFALPLYQDKQRSQPTPM